MKQEGKYSVVITTVATAEDAEKLAKILLEKKLAACAQTYPIQSHYTWKGQLKTEPENMLLIKTAASRYKEVEEAIKANHSYDVPEIIQVPITDGSAAYLGWIDEVIR